jgi:hypothetical protein
MGILAQDTDFLIYQTSVPYYSIKKLDISTLRYDKKSESVMLVIIGHHIIIIAVPY